MLGAKLKRSATRGGCMATRPGVFLLENEYFWLPREESSLATQRGELVGEVETQGDAGRVHGAILITR